MRCIAIPLLAIAMTASVSAQQQFDSTHPGAGVAAKSDVPNLSSEKLGQDDVVSVTVYDAPELSRNVRVDAEGKIRLPMLQQHIQAAGLTPPELEKAIAAALVDEQVMVDPVVSVSVVEYHSRPITVIGAVRSPQTFQASGTITLLEAITRAGGLTDNAGADILVSHPGTSPSGVPITLTDRIPVHSLLDISNPVSNLKLEGGEYIRVPQAGQVFVAGNVRRPGPFMITNESESSVLRALSIAGGLDSFSSRTAYIYRTDENSGLKSQIPIQIKKIVARKSPDVPLYGDDMLYVPSATGQRVSAKALEITMGVGLGVAGLLLYLVQ